jgi:hypothetical protein
MKHITISAPVYGYLPEVEWIKTITSIIVYLYSPPLSYGASAVFGSWGFKTI